MLKRTIIVAAISGIMAFGLAGCSSSAASSSSASAESSPSSAVVESPSSSSNNSDTATAADKDLGGKISLPTFYSNVPNDVTGNWRCLVYRSNLEPQDLAIDYYKEYFNSDGEIHALVNLDKQETAALSLVGNSLDVTVYEYVKGEEHDAKILFSGNVVAEYSVNPETGETEKLQ